MFDQTLIYQKSGKGAEAMAARSAQLTPKLRSMLILIDGKRSFAELAKLAALLGEPQQLMAQLEAAGMIEPAAGARPATAAPTRPVSAPVPLAPVGTVPLLQAQRHASRRLTDLMGPAAEDLCLRIEATRNAQEFHAALLRAERTLKQFGGDGLAARFMTDMEGHRPL